MRSFVGFRLLRLVLHPISAVLVFVGLCALFATVLHPWFMNWGATAEERTMVLPGDAAPPAAYLTRAISIDAPPSAVWPWLLAIGQDRAGFLSNDYLENLAGADIHNADTLRPEWQQRAIGDKVPMSGETERTLGGDYTLLTVRILEPERVIGDIPGRFVLQPVGDSETRLLLREALAIPERAGYAWVIWDPMHFVMEQRMLQGIKERVDSSEVIGGPSPDAPGGRLSRFASLMPTGGSGRRPRPIRPGEPLEPRNASARASPASGRLATARVASCAIYRVRRPRRAQAPGAPTPRRRALVWSIHSRHQPPAGRGARPPLPSPPYRPARLQAAECLDARHGCGTDPPECAAVPAPPR